MIKPFELYRLENGSYQLQIGEPFWMSEISLGIGRSPYQDGNKAIESLYWYNQQGTRYLAPEEQLELYRQRFGDLTDVYIDRYSVVGAIARPS